LAGCLILAAAGFFSGAGDSLPRNFAMSFLSMGDDVKNQRRRFAG
jgi:hypothetical protein